MIGWCEALALSYRAVKTACRYDKPSRIYLEASEQKVQVLLAMSERADSEHVIVQ